MATCPVCHSEGELGQECPTDHRYFVEKTALQNDPNDPMLGSLIGGQYIPLSLIGEGGMGKIYRAKAKYTAKYVALKILKSEFMEDETLKERFFREAEVVSALEHPNIVKLYSCAPEPGFNTIFMAMELLKGETLFEVLRDSVPDLKTVLQWFVEISSALGEAHKNGIIHRDLKPENIIIVNGEDGKRHTKVLDFGFARLQGASKKLTMAGVAFGTPHYMSPEQAMGLTEITSAVDVYALGIMLFQVISGHVPYGSKNNNPTVVMTSQVYDAIPTCVPRQEYQVPNSLLSCIYKCMAKDPKERYASGKELNKELVRISENLDQLLEHDEKMPDKVPSPIPSIHGAQAIVEESVPVSLSTTNRILIAVLVVLIIAVIAVVASIL